jgi:dihydroorotase-like cyclic amidohydrolase
MRMAFSGTVRLDHTVKVKTLYKQVDYSMFEGFKKNGKMRRVMSRGT